MERRLPHNIRLGRASGRTQAAAALLEVLVALFVLGIGLLALLTVFPLGALAMAKAIQDDRTATFANDAVAFGQAGEELILRTKDFVEASLSSGSVDLGCDGSPARRVRRLHTRGGRPHDARCRIQGLCPRDAG
jgi:hypothetical protein